MMIPPPVSVLLSCYNGEPWLLESLESILAQTFPDFEFVILDDGSTDGSPGIIRTIAERDPRVVSIRKPNTGLADSLNVGLARARGEWIARIDADDLAMPTRLARQLAFVRANPGVLYLGSGDRLVDSGACPVRTNRYPPDHKTLKRNLTTIRAFPSHSSSFYHRETVLALGGYRGRVRRAEDCDLWLRLSEVGELACLPDPLVQIRNHPMRITYQGAGTPMMMDGWMAVVCHWIRVAGYPDPVTSNDGDYTVFRDFLEKRLRAAGLIARVCWRTEVKAAMAKGGSAAVCRVLRLLIRHPMLFGGALKERWLQPIFGTRLPKQIARAWVEKEHGGGPDGNARNRLP